MRQAAFVLAVAAVAGSASAQQCYWVLNTGQSFDIQWADETTLIFGGCSIIESAQTVSYNAGSATRTWTIIWDPQKEAEISCSAEINWDPLLDPTDPRNIVAQWSAGSVEVPGLTCYEKYVLWKGKNLQQVWDSFVQEERLDIGIERAGAIFYAFEIKEKFYPHPGGPG